MLVIFLLGVVLGKVVGGLCWLGVVVNSGSGVLLRLCIVYRAWWWLRFKDLKVLVCVRVLSVVCLLLLCCYRLGMFW